MKEITINFNILYCKHLENLIMFKAIEILS